MDLWETRAAHLEEDQNKRLAAAEDKELFWNSDSERRISDHIDEYRKLSKTYQADK